MAKTRYFHVKHTTTGAEHLVKAPRQGNAIEAISGGRSAIRQATDDEIRSHLTNGGALHEKSCAEGEGKLFIAGEPASLIRAKNASAAFQLLNDGAYTVEVASQDALVRLLTAGVPVVDYVEPESKTKPADSTDAAQTEPDAGATAPDAANDAAGGETISSDAGDQGEAPVSTGDAEEASQAA